MNIKKAFDGVDVDKMLITLKDIKVRGRLKRFIRAYLKGTTFVVKQGATISSPRPLLMFVLAYYVICSAMSPCRASFPCLALETPFPSRQPSTLAMFAA